VPRRTTVSTSLVRWRHSTTPPWYAGRARQLPRTLLLPQAIRRMHDKGIDCVLVVGPEHGHVFAEAGWDRDRLLAELHARLQIPGADLVRGAADMAEGVPDWLAGETLGKFRPDGLLLAYAGGGAGLFSAMIGGWANGSTGSRPVTRRVVP